MEVERAYRKDYWGFVYIWRDRRSGMSCIGSHLGRVDDGYLSSTGLLKKAYRKRPHDFMRRIIYWLPVDDRELLLKEEARWLSFIQDNELSTVENLEAGTARYYNCKKFAIGGAWNKGRTGVQIYLKRPCEHCGKSFNLGMYAAWHGERCIKNPSLSDAHIKTRERKKGIRQASYVADNINSLPYVRCDVCGMLTCRGNIKRWHGPNCKIRRTRSDVVAVRQSL